MLEILHYKIFFGHWNDSDLYNLITEFFRKCCNLVNFIFNWKGDWILWVALPLFMWVALQDICGAVRFIFGVRIKICSHIFVLVLLHLTMEWWSPLGVPLKDNVYCQYQESAITVWKIESGIFLSWTQNCAF